MTESYRDVIYDSAKRPPRPVEELLHVIQYRDLIFQLLRRDLLTRYKRSVLGIAWTMIGPLGTMLVLSIVFSQAFGTVKGYPAYILSGLMAWNLFSQTSNASMINLVWGGGLLHRIYIPRTSFALAAVGTGLINTLFALVPLLIVMLLFGIPIRWTIVFLPVPFILIAAFALGFGLILSTFAVFFPDVAEMYQIVLTAWMYLTPILYPEEILPAQFRALIIFLNPMYSLVILRQFAYPGRTAAQRAHFADFSGGGLDFLLTAFRRIRVPRVNYAIEITCSIIRRYFCPVRERVGALPGSHRSDWHI
jgi:ABC-2 type transport system permease protein